MANRPGESLGRLIVGIHSRGGNQAGSPPVEPTQDFSAVTDEHQTFIAPRHRIFLIQLGRARRLQFAVIPGDPDRQHIAPRRKIEMDDGTGGEGFFKFRSRAGFNANRRVQFHDPENRVEAVAAHIPQGTVAEIVPTTPDERQINMVKEAFGRRAEP